MRQPCQRDIFAHLAYKYGTRTESKFTPHNPLYIKYSESVTTLLPRASQGSYRERLSALTESVTRLLPRASQRSYRERLSALTESVSALLPRASQRSYRERFWGHYYPSGRALRICVTDPVRKLPPQPSSCPTLSRSDTAPTAEGRASQTALLPLSEGRASGEPREEASLHLETHFGDQADYHR